MRRLVLRQSNFPRVAQTPAFAITIRCRLLRFSSYILMHVFCPLARNLGRPSSAYDGMQWRNKLIRTKITTPRITAATSAAAACRCRRHRPSKVIYPILIVRHCCCPTVLLTHAPNKIAQTKKRKESNNNLHRSRLGLVCDS